MEAAEVIIKCKGADEVSLDELQLLHHFKTITDDDYARGRNILIERGFKFPFSVWLDGENGKWTIDGNQRLTILKKMREEGVKMPEKFPINYVIADSKQDAAKDIIASESKFAEINPDEFSTFLEDNSINWEEVEDWANIPDLEEGPEDDKSDGGSKIEKYTTCPQCQNRFIPKFD